MPRRQCHWHSSLTLSKGQMGKERMVRVVISCRTMRASAFQVFSTIPSFFTNISYIFFLDTINEEILSLTQTRLDFGMRPGIDCSFSGSLDTLLSSHPSHEQNLVSTPDRVECSTKGGEQQPPWSLWPAFTPIENGKSSKFSLSDLTKESMPYEPLFDLALPKVASLFLERKTAEAFQRAGGEKEDREELEGEDLSATSPLEVLDRVIQQGHDTHEKVLKRYASILLTSKSILEEMCWNDVRLLSYRTLSSQSQSADQHSGGKQHSNKGKGI